MSGSSYTLAGGVIRNSSANITNLSADFIGNHIQKGNGADQIFGGLINNEGTAEIDKISGNFLYNEVIAGDVSYLFGGLIYNGSYGGNPSPIGEISGNFEHNTVKGSAYLVYGGLIANYYGKALGNISGDYLNNTVSAEGGSYAVGLIYIDNKAGDITGDFKNNTLENANIIYGVIVNDAGEINSITGSTFESNVSKGVSYVYGGALVNDGVITNGLINTKFIDNGAIATSATGDALGGAICMTTDLKISADGSVGDGISTFQGNYTQIGDGDKKYEAIYVSADTTGNTPALTLEAKNNGIINLYDYINGDDGYETIINGDATGTVNLYNDIKNSDVSIEKVNVSTADGTLHDYELLSLTVDANANWKIDVDAINQQADTLTTDAEAATASIGTLTLNEINYADSTKSDLTDGFKVQILKTQGTATAADLQLALSDDLQEEFVISQTENTVTDDVTADTKWSDEFYKTTTTTTVSGQYELATTDTLNDSIGVTTSSDSTDVKEKLGDTLALVDAADLEGVKTFAAESAEEVYTATDDLGAVKGRLIVQGVADGESKSTIDLNGYNNFEVPEVAELYLYDAAITGEADLNSAGILEMNNAAVDSSINNSGYINAANSELSALYNNGTADFASVTANTVSNSGYLNAYDSEIARLDNGGEAYVDDVTMTDVINSGTFNAENSELSTLDNSNVAGLTNVTATEVNNVASLNASDSEFSTFYNSGDAIVESSEFVQLNNTGYVSLAYSDVTNLINEGEAIIDSSQVETLSNDNSVTAYYSDIKDATNDGNMFISESEVGDLTNNGAVTLENSVAGNIYNTGSVDLDNSEFTRIGGYDGEVNLQSDIDLSDKQISNNAVYLQGVQATAGADSFGENVDLIVEDGSEVDIATNKVSVRNAVFAEGSQLSLKVNNIKDYGALSADSFDIADGATLDVTFGQNPLDGAKTGEVMLLSLNDGSDIDNNNFADNFHNNMYEFVRKSDKSGTYGVYQTKTAEEISREYGGTKTNQGAAAAWVDGDSFAGGTAAAVADKLADLAQNDGAAFNENLTAIAPNDDGMVQAVAADLTDRLLLTVDNHLADSVQEQGLASGDKGKTRGYPDLSGVSTWAKGYYGKAKLQRRADIHGFDMDSRGIIAGADRKFTPSIKVGLGMQYDDSDIDAFRRDVSAKTTLGFAYGEYRPSNWFVSGVFGYGVTDYDENKHAAGQNIAAHYKAEIYSVQGLTGYNFKYFTPEIGARYYKIKRHGYVDGARQAVSGENMDLLRTLAGVKAHTTYGMFKPNAYFGITYDVVSDRDNAVVNLDNGASYTVHGKRLPRFGVEFGAGVTAQVTAKLEAALGYEAKFRKDYQDHSVVAAAKYNF